MIVKIYENYTVCRCKQCGKTWSFQITEDALRLDFVKEHVGQFICPDCTQKKEQLKLENDERAKKLELERSFPARLDKTDIPAKMIDIEEPPVKTVAEWIWKNRDKNLLISGETGTGKTTSAVVVVRRMLKQQALKIRYYNAMDLLLAWRSAKTSDRAADPQNFLERLGDLDLLIIDELVSKTKITACGAELLYDLIDGVYSGKHHCKLWLIGNFYRNAIPDIFPDPEPVYRRLHESFDCVEIKYNEITPLSVK